MAIRELVLIAVAGLISAEILTASRADARVSRIEITERSMFADGQPYGEVGAYERIAGRFYGELDPKQKLNAGIVDLDKAPLNARGRVEYSADFFLLKPANMAKGNGALLYDVNNRGNKRALVQFNSAPARNDPRTAADGGNGFLMRHGFSVVWSGWIPGLPSANNALRIVVPTAGEAVEQKIWDEFLFNDATSTRARLTFPASRTDGGNSTLLVRGRNEESPAVVPADKWEFIDRQAIRLLPAGTPFRQGAIYQLIYPARNPPVSGIGFAATRDLVSFLRREVGDDAGNPNPLAMPGRAAVERALAHGTSQSGRYLRDFIYRGFNEDEAGRIVFDGINPHIATGRLFLNQRFSQPNRMMSVAHGFMFFPDTTFPFAYETQTDPFTGRSDGILARCSARNNCPKAVHTVSAVEYWQSGQSLITTDPLGRYDGTPPDNVRIYHVASTQHIEIPTMPKGVCALPYNPTDLRPVLRALLLALDRWVKDGSPPPRSRYPRIADNSLVPMAQLGFPAVPGITLPRQPNPKFRFDYGQNFAEGIISKVLPETLADAYRVLVPRVDSDGNEVGGIRLPTVAVPIGTATGWAVRASSAGGAGELCYLDGFFAPFAKTKSEREVKGDPRPSLEERYRDHALYAAKVLQAALALEREGYILGEDVQRIAEHAAQ